MTSIDALKEQITLKNRHLQMLKRREAIEGIKTDPGVLIQIEDLEKEIRQLEAELQQLQAEATTPFQTKPSAPVMTPKPAGPPKLFFSYAHQDEAMRDKLATHLKLLQRQGKIAAWHDRQIEAGSEWRQEIEQELNSADIIVLLISNDFLASDFCYDVELQRAIERHNAGEAVVIPVILRPCDWAGAPFSKLQALPKNAQPVSRWPDEDEAYLNIAEGVRGVAERLSKNR